MIIATRAVLQPMAVALSLFCAGPVMATQVVREQALDITGTDPEVSYDLYGGIGLTMGSGNDLEVINRIDFSYLIVDEKSTNLENTSFAIRTGTASFSSRYQISGNGFADSFSISNDIPYELLPFQSKDLFSSASKVDSFQISNLSSFYQNPGFLVNISRTDTIDAPSNIDASLETRTSGLLRATYTYTRVFPPSPPPVVPEPVTWSMMIAGFGLVGGAMRRQARPFAAPMGARP